MTTKEEKYGLSEADWLEAQRIIEMNNSYMEMCAEHSGEPLDYNQVLKDTIHKWRFIMRWVEKQDNSYAAHLHEQQAASLIEKILVSDEPLCWEAQFHPEIKDACKACALFMLTGKPCNQPGGFKFNLMKPWVDKKGQFKPRRMFITLVRILKGHPIRTLEL